MKETNPSLVSSDSVLGIHSEPQLPQSTASAPPKSYTYYHAGPLFSISDLHVNTLLSRAVRQRSNGRYIPIVPQDLEQRDLSPHSIRDSDIRALLSCDLALFVYDGPELDSGTVVEYMFAKMADMPTVIVRTDFRGAGDQGVGDPWNLMSSFYPRTERVVLNGMLLYKEGMAAEAARRAVESATGSVEGGYDVGSEAGGLMIERTADAIVAAFDKVSQRPSILPKQLQQSVYEWLALMPGLRDGGKENIDEMLKLCTDKNKKGLL